MQANYHQMVDRIDALVTVAGLAAMLGWLDMGTGAGGANTVIA